MRDNDRVRNLVMLGVLLVWMMYLGASILRGEQPEKWTWGIAPGVYAALYRPGMGKGSREVQDGDGGTRRLPSARKRAAPSKQPAEDAE